MALPDSPRKLTYDDYLLFPEDDGLRHEILDGEHYVTAAPFFRHQFLAGRLYLRLGRFVEERDLGVAVFAPVDVLLSPYDIAQPDLLFISKERAGIITKKNLQGAPDLVVEILSESTRRRDGGIKLERYDRFGVGEYWMLDPDSKAAWVYRRDGGRLRRAAELSAEDVLTSPLLPGLEIRLAEVFE
ncbi:MAG TPA: Uma2 family endonuclease [Thermoanaerobaculia bacterium]|jgi:Uma2 family endonuclease|nr:Uma2 family endonuclease [Thermoanaerobaculia bacterium]